MGEPEFFLMDRDVPLKAILTGDEIEEIARKVQTPKGSNATIQTRKMY